jgi:toxin ParE1/3/4
VKALHVHEDDSAEYGEATEWYEARNPEVALRFVTSVETTIESVHRAPIESPLHPTVSAGLQVRRRLVPNFPYSIVYLHTDVAVFVLAVAHGKREPNYWRSRMPPRH